MFDSVELKSPYWLALIFWTQVHMGCTWVWF
jgi:hypothetical protein